MNLTKNPFMDSRLVLIPIITLQVLYGHTLNRSPLTESYIQFEQTTEDRVTALVPLLKEGQTSIEERPSDHDEMADTPGRVNRPDCFLPDGTLAGRIPIA